MAIFSSNDKGHKNSSPDKNTTIITAGSKIKGEIDITCNLYIDGEFEGVIRSSKEVNIGKNGHIKGDIVTKRLVVQGYIEGCINSEIVEIKADGRVSGTIEAMELIIEPKGVFEGNSIIKNSAENLLEVDDKKQLNKPTE